MEQGWLAGLETTGLWLKPAGVLDGTYSCKQRTHRSLPTMGQAPCSLASRDLLLLSLKWKA